MTSTEKYVAAAYLAVFVMILFDRCDDDIFSHRLGV